MRGNQEGPAEPTVDARLADGTCATFAMPDGQGGITLRRARVTRVDHPIHGAVFGVVLEPEPLAAGATTAGDALLHALVGSAAGAASCDPSGTLSASPADPSSPSPRDDLEEAAGRLAAIVHASDDAIYSKAVDGSITTWNRGAEQLYGYLAEEVRGRPASMLVPPDRTDDYAELQVRMRSGQPVEHYETVRRRKDGSDVHVSLSTSPLRDRRGQLIGAAVIGRDVSQAKRAEAAIRASLREKEVLLKEIHHRVKNNLQVISSLLKLHAEQLDDPRAQSAFEDSQSRVRSIALLHENLYRASNLGHVDVGDYARSLVDALLRGQSTRSVAIRIEAAGVHLDVDTALPCGLILNELMTNALKHAFAPDAVAPTVRVQVRRDGDDVEIVVADNGRGLPPGIGLEQGTGLGMHLVRTLGRQLDASIHLAGAPGGTTCSVRFTAPLQEDA